MVERQKFSKRLWEFYCALVRWVFYYKPVGITEEDRKRIFKQESAKTGPLPVAYIPRMKQSCAVGDKTRARIKLMEQARKKLRREERKKRKNEMKQAFKALF